MKKYFFLLLPLLAVTFFFGACKKKTDEPGPGDSGYTNESVQGSWEVDEINNKVYYNDIIQQDTTYDYTAGEQVMKFTGNTLIRLYDNSSYSDTLNFEVKGTSLIKLFPGGSKDTLTLQIDGSTMTLTQIMYDPPFNGQTVRKEEVTKAVKQ